MNGTEIESFFDCDALNISDTEQSHQYKYPIQINKTHWTSAWLTRALMKDVYKHAAFQGDFKTQSTCNELNCVVDTRILPILGAMGIIGNIGGIICFAKKLKTTYYALLFALAISDLATIVSFLFYYSFPHLFDWHTLLECHICSYIIIGAYCVKHTSQVIDIYLLVALSIERYFAICRPMYHRARKLSVFYYIIPILILSICYSFPIFFEHEIVPYDEELEKFHCQNSNQKLLKNATIYLLQQTDLKMNKSYNIIYETGCKLVVKCIAPYILLISTNLFMVRVFFDLYRTTYNEERQPDPEEDQGGQQTDGLRVHTTTTGARERQSQVNLGFLNLAISIVFMMCYSLIWLWAIYDLVGLFKISSSKVCLSHQYKI